MNVLLCLLTTFLLFFIENVKVDTITSSAHRINALQNLFYSENSNFKKYFNNLIHFVQYPLCSCSGCIF